MPLEQSYRPKSLQRKSWRILCQWWRQECWRWWWWLLTQFIFSTKRPVWDEIVLTFEKIVPTQFNWGKERGGQRREKIKKVSSAQFFAHYSAFLILCQDFTTIPYIVFMMKALLIQMEGGMFSLPKLKLSLEFKPSLGVTPISHWIYNCKGKLYILH